MLEYPSVKAGLILMMDRRLTPAQNGIIVQKAIRYYGKGVVGVDLAGPDQRGFRMAEVTPLFHQARDAGLGITVHCGETGDLDEMNYVVREVRPHRIGHGIAAARERKLMDKLVENEITLELCPTSNIKNGMVRDARQLKQIVSTLQKNDVRITVNTDGPELYHTNVFKEQEFLVKIGAMTHKQVARCNQLAFEASFIRNGNSVHACDTRPARVGRTFPDAQQSQ
jgi:adenosine deaminase